MKTTIEIPDELFRRAKAIAAARGQTLRQLVIAALENKLAEPIATPENLEDKAGKAEAFARELEALVEKISASWKSDLDAVEAVREQRRY